MIDGAEILAPAGRLAAAMEGYEDRPGQRELAAAVARALDRETALLAEAGTGTGKTLAYLMPAIASGKRVVVSTGTKTLQDQLAYTDVPTIERALGRRVDAVALKGVSNYLCRRKFRRALAGSIAGGKTVRLPSTSPVTDDGRDAAAGSWRARLDRLAAWAKTTQNGDRGELSDIPEDDPIWEAITTDAEARLGPRCPHYESCFVTHARRRAATAELVLVNHHLFFADLALHNEHPGARVLPPYDAVIFDEAHGLESVITEHFGVGVSSFALSRLSRDFREQLGASGGRPRERDAGAGGKDAARGARAAFAMAMQLDARAAELFGHLRASLEESGGHGGRRPLRPEAFSGEAQGAYLGLDTALEAMLAHATLAAESPPASDPDDETAELAAALARRAARHRDTLALLAEQPTETYAYFGELRGEGTFLGAAPIDVHHVLRDKLLSGTPAAVLTSATLSAGGDFSYTRDRLGLEEDVADEIAVESPFDFASQAILYVPRDLCEPSEAGFSIECAGRIAQLAEITIGRALALFTSHRALRAASAELRRTSAFPVLAQGEAPRHELLARFRREPAAILCATGSFWEGIDIPGDALSLVVIDKLPFTAPGDPMAAGRIRALERRGLDPFSTYQLPRAALALKQGFGRLIRRRTDRGIAAVLDRRLVTRSYGRVFFDSLPAELPRTSHVERLRRWWAARDEP